MTEPGGLRPVTIWYALGTDGRRIYVRNATKAEQAVMAMGTKGMDVVPVVVHRSKDGILIALNDAASGRTK